MAPELTFPTKTIAKLLDLTTARVGQLAREGIISRHESGKYPASAVPQYVKWLRAKAFGSDEKIGDTNAERARLLRAQSEKLERENRIADGEVAPVEVLTAALADVLSQMVAILESIPMNIKRAVPALSARDIEMIKKEIVKCRNLAADANIKEHLEDGH